MITENEMMQARIEACNSNPNAHRALRSVVALRELTKQTGTKTTLAQNRILQSLSDEELTLVADVLESLRAN
jgi:hypothetical protein